jgi:6-phospho-beta-glucosidase
MEARRGDEYLGRRHNLIGQETTGVGGMAKALRTIPVILKIAQDMAALAPGSLLVNFTNPSGLVTEALQSYAIDVPSVGLCNIPIGMKNAQLQSLESAMGVKIAPERVELKTLGLNHLTWHYGFTLDGEDVWPSILKRYITGLKADPEAEWDPRIIETLRMIPNNYLHYFYDTANLLSQQQNWPPSRAEEVMEIEKDLIRQYADPSLVAPPADLMKRGGAYYSTAAAQLLNAHYNNLGGTHVVNTRHAGAVRAGLRTGCWRCPAESSGAGFTLCLPTPCHRFVSG